MKVAINLEIVNIKKGVFTDPENGKSFEYFQGTLADGTGIKLSKEVFDGLKNGKVVSDITLAKGSKLTTPGDDLIKL